MRRDPRGSLRSDLPLVLVGWGAVAVLFALHTWLTYRAHGRATPFAHATAWSLAEWATWAVLTPAIFALCRRAPLAGERWPLAVGVHLVAGVLFGGVQVALELGLDRLLVTLLHDPAASVVTWLSDAARTASASFGYLFTRKIGFDYAVYWAIVLAGHALSYARLSRHRALRGERLRRELSDARLEALRAQLRPHFLFNTLNAVSELVHEDPEAADRMLAELGALLRASLVDDAGETVPLERELELLDAYLAIQRRRMGDRLRVRREVDPATLGLGVPPLLLQPLAENAVRHGLAGREGGGTLRIAARLEDGGLVVEVGDDGGGPPEGGIREGVGLRNTRR
ncbi:MAG: histidine kinase, partial [Gemmatimonadetes bacterium]|nr:histidine kinase [Gemmatimonadota bacterium]NIR78628.1 histidine kinase [Gemmatimonadota bacterium]NIT87246.1 histidine kinase [Gemmatimonadota bacterium]NIU31089.1 histidine kinase [Gemmatimonadota bacterium]NIU35825.1 histidine kinase [Gemmatimonadota bacterium]